MVTTGHGNTVWSSLTAPASGHRHRHSVVVVGGGTGSHTVLTGLRTLDVELAAVVSVMDSGGSSGRLRDDYGVLPPGDARQCLVALASDDEIARMLRVLFTYRFRGFRLDDAVDGQRSLDGHSLGNLFLSALMDITGSVENAYAWAGRLLAARGRVIPVSTSNVRLCARLTDGHVLTGEAAIDVRSEHPEAAIDYVYLDAPAYPTAAAVEVLNSADLVVIGPGDLYTSIVPNLLVEGIVDAIAAARHRVFIVNLMSKPGETDGYTASMFVERLLEYLAPATLDAVLVNTATPSPKVRQRYANEGAFPVQLDTDAIREFCATVIAEPLASTHYFMRHDPALLARSIQHWLEALEGTTGQSGNGHLSRELVSEAVEVLAAR
jgi:uncharacterized cofD-like protein